MPLILDAVATGTPCGFRISEALGIRAVDINPRARGRKADVVRIRRKRTATT